jgi:uncharacterized protein with von Willebrand factor type A (vWA) domain
MSDPRSSELLIPPHFTNIQHALHLARRFLSAQDTPNRQVMLITDGLPTAHFEGEMLYMLYPPQPRTEEATLREGMLQPSLRLRHLAALSGMLMVLGSREPGT